MAELSSLSKRTFKSLIWNSSGVAIQGGLQLIVLVILSRLLDPKDFGLIGAALIVVGLSTIISQIGIGQTIIQRPSLTDRHLSAGFLISVSIGLSVGLFIWILSSPIARLFNMPGLVNILKFIAIICPLKGLTVVSESLLQREMNFKLLAFIDIISFTFGYGILGIILAALNYGVWALVGAHMGQAALKTIGLIYSRGHPMLSGFTKSILQELIHYGFGFSLVRISNYVANEGDNFIIGKWLGGESLGVYGRAYQLITMPASLFGYMIEKVLFPAMATIQYDYLRLALIFRRGIGTMGILMMPTSIFVAILAPEIIYLLLGQNWIMVVVPFQILSIGILFRISFKMSALLARSVGAVYESAWRQGVYAILVLTGAWVGHYWGINGVAMGVLIALFINYLLMADLGIKLARIKWVDFLHDHLPGIILTFVVGLVSLICVTVLREHLIPPIGVAIVTTLVTGACILGFWMSWFKGYLVANKTFYLFPINEYISKAIGRT